MMAALADKFMDALRENLQPEYLLHEVWISYYRNCEKINICFLKLLILG
jgi:hypothetical protein